MIEVICTDKIRNKNNIITHYKIKDENDNETTMNAKQLKRMISDNRINIVNLTLTSNNRLVDKKYKSKQQEPKEQTYLEKLLIKLKVLGYSIKEIEVIGNKCIYLASKNDNNHILYIPDGVNDLRSKNKIYTESDSYKILKNLVGTLKVMGGKDLVTTRLMFKYFNINKLDLSNFDTSNVKDMGFMFDTCAAKDIDVSNLNTSNVIDMESMFNNCSLKASSILNLDTSNVKTMFQMFSDCKVDTLDLSNFNTSKVTTMSYMFYNCKANTINISNLDTSSVIHMDSMFRQTNISVLDLTCLNTSNVVSMTNMFSKCVSDTINLSGLDISKLRDAERMFYKCNIQNLYMNNLSTSSLTSADFMFYGCKASNVELKGFHIPNHVIKTLDLIKGSCANITKAILNNGGKK